MRYYPFRDNPELAGLTDSDEIGIVALSEIIDESSARGNHVNACNCDKGKRCSSWMYRVASSEETIGWLVAQGLLEMEDIHNALMLFHGRGL